MNHRVLYLVVPRRELAGDKIIIIARAGANTAFSYFIDAVEYPHTFEQLRTTSVGQKLRPLVASLSENVHHPAIVAALLLVIPLRVKFAAS